MLTCNITSVPKIYICGKTSDLFMFNDGSTTKTKNNKNYIHSYLEKSKTSNSGQREYLLVTGSARDLSLVRMVMFFMVEPAH